MIPPADFKPPFKFDDHSYIRDANGRMAADIGEEGYDDYVVRARGWGRIQSLREPRAGLEAQALMDEWEAWVAAAVGDATTGPEAARRMNAACAPGEGP